MEVSRIISQLHREIAEKILESEEAVECENEIDEYEKLARYRKAQNRSTKWSLKKRRVLLTGILDDDGAPIQNSEEAAKHLHGYWSQAAVSKESKDDWWETLAKYIQKAPKGTEWKLSLEKFWELVLKLSKKITVPGPDGMPYRVFVYGGIDGPACQILYGIYENICKGISPPSSFVDALMVFIPKDLPGENLSDCGARKAESVRPLCLGNCAAKIVTAAVVDPLVKLSESLVDKGA